VALPVLAAAFLVNPRLPPSPEASADEKAGYKPPKLIPSFSLGLISKNI